MSISLSSFGTLADGRAATLYTLTNASGARLCLTDYGARVVSVRVPDRSGALADVALGFDSAADYAKIDNSVGATIGRVGNRIGGASFSINGQVYHVDANEGVNCLHGGRNGFARQMWHAEPHEGEDGDVVTFTYTSADGEEGFPGTLSVTVSIGWTAQNDLSICYSAVSDKDTLCNLTNHAYFNLAGQGNIEDHVLTLNAPFVTETDDALIPTGKELPVDGLPVDFRAGLRLGDGFARSSEYPMMVKKNGYDFNFAVAGSGMRCFGTLYDPQSGRIMHLCSTEPCVQVYSAQHMHFEGHHGTAYGCHAGLALETQHHPDAIHHPNFPSVLLRAGVPYETQTVYSFGVKQASLHIKRYSFMKRLLYAILLLFCFSSAALAEDVWVDEFWQHVNAEYDCGDLSLVIDADIMDIPEGTSVREYHAEYLSDDFIIRKGQEADWSLLGIDTSCGAWRLPTKDYPEYDFVPDNGTLYPSISLSTLHLNAAAFNSYYIYLDDAHWTYDISPISVDGLTEQQFAEYVENVASICGYQVGNMVQLQQVNDVEAVRNLISAANQISSAEYKPDADKAAEYLFAQAYYPVYYNGLRLYSGTYSAAEDGMEIPPLNLRIAVTSGHGLAFCSSVLLDLSDLAPIGDEQPAITAQDIISSMVDYYNSTSKPGTKRITVKQIALEYVPKTGEKASDQGFTLYPAWVVRYELETEQGERISLYQGYHAATGESLFVR